jgi:hypothetical protein
MISESTTNNPLCTLVLPGCGTNKTECFASIAPPPLGGLLPPVNLVASSNDHLQEYKAQTIESLYAVSNALDYLIARKRQELRVMLQLPHLYKTPSMVLAFEHKHWQDNPNVDIINDATCQAIARQIFYLYDMNKLFFPPKAYLFPNDVKCTIHCHYKGCQEIDITGDSSHVLPIIRIKSHIVQKKLYLYNDIHGESIFMSSEEKKTLGIIKDDDYENQGWKNSKQSEYAFNWICANNSKEQKSDSQCNETISTATAMSIYATSRQTTGFLAITTAGQGDTCPNFKVIDSINTTRATKEASLLCDSLAKQLQVPDMSAEFPRSWVALLEEWDCNYMDWYTKHGFCSQWDNFLQQQYSKRLRGIRLLGKHANALKIDVQWMAVQLNALRGISRCSNH